MGKKAAKSKVVEYNRKPWSDSEDNLLRHYVHLHGEGKWRKVSKSTGLKRSGKSCRLRWLNRMKEQTNPGNGNTRASNVNVIFSEDEEDLIVRLHKLLGDRWSLIAGRLPGRTDNEIKNYWQTILRKKVEDSKLDEETVASNSFPMIV